MEIINSSQIQIPQSTTLRAAHILPHTVSRQSIPPVPLPPPSTGPVPPYAYCVVPSTPNISTPSTRCIPPPPPPCTSRASSIPQRIVDPACSQSPIREGFPYSPPHPDLSVLNGPAPHLLKTSKNGLYPEQFQSMLQNILPKASNGCATSYALPMYPSHPRCLMPGKDMKPSSSNVYHHSARPSGAVAFATLVPSLQSNKQLLGVQPLGPSSLRGACIATSDKDISIVPSSLPSFREQEEAKRQQKRALNRESAQRCRKRKRAMLEELIRANKLFALHAAILDGTDTTYIAFLPHNGLILQAHGTKHLGWEESALISRSVYDVIAEARREEVRGMMNGWSRGDGRCVGGIGNAAAADGVGEGEARIEEGQGSRPQSSEGSSVHDTLQSSPSSRDSHGEQEHCLSPPVRVNLSVGPGKQARSASICSLQTAPETTATDSTSHPPISDMRPSSPSSPLSAAEIMEYAGGHLVMNVASHKQGRSHTELMSGLGTGWEGKRERTGSRRKASQDSANWLIREKPCSSKRGKGRQSSLRGAGEGTLEDMELSVTSRTSSSGSNQFTSKEPGSSTNFNISQFLNRTPSVPREIEHQLMDVSFCTQVGTHVILADVNGVVIFEHDRAVRPECIWSICIKGKRLQEQLDCGRLDREVS